ncbi:MAG: hypothetical protein WA919_14705 [Coleofasciculaceae cyanobacterium]
MSPRKLSDADKSEILKLYRRESETTSTLASRYGVSNSTISRILKSNLLESEYEALIQQKRLSRTSTSSTSAANSQTTQLPVEAEAKSSPERPTIHPPVLGESKSSVETLNNQGRRRKRSSLPYSTEEEKNNLHTQLELDIVDKAPKIKTKKVEVEQEDELLDEDDIDSRETSGYEALLDEDLIDLDDDDDDEDDDEDDDDLDEDWDDDESDEQTQEPVRRSFPQRGIQVQVLPLSEASLPKICYLVVDKTAELIARPLKEFGDLGKIPEDEFQEKTLPVFDNHRVARRFSNRSQRVIKVPDGRMLQKTSDHLQAKGITRLLIDGQIYSLSSL